MEIDRVLLVNALQWHTEFVPEKILEFMILYEEARQINSVKDPFFTERGIEYPGPDS